MGKDYKMVQEGERKRLEVSGDGVCEDTAEHVKLLGDDWHARDLSLEPGIRD